MTADTPTELEATLRDRAGDGRYDIRPSIRVLMLEAADALKAALQENDQAHRNAALDFLNVCSANERAETAEAKATALQAEVDRLRDALEPLKRYAGYLETGQDAIDVPAADLVRVLAALSPVPEGTIEVFASGTGA